MQVFMCGKNSLLLGFSWRKKKKGCDLHSLLGFQDKLDGFVPAHFFGWYLKVRMAHFTLRTLLLSSQSLTAAAFVVPSLGHLNQAACNTWMYISMCEKPFFPFFLSPAHVRPPHFFPELCYINSLLPPTAGIHPGVRSIENLIPLATEMLERPLEVECGADSDSDIPKSRYCCCCFPRGIRSGF